VIECSRPAELRTLSFGPLNSFFTPFADQIALELGNAAAHDRHYQSADVGRGIAPGLTERDKAAADLPQLVQNILQVAARRG
jgi:hypothetical protein